VSAPLEWITKIMPLLTDDLKNARQSYELLESRLQSAEQRAETLQAALRVQPQSVLDEIPLLRQRILGLEAENNKLRSQVDQLKQDRTDVPLQDFVAAIGLAAAIGEASMPDRAIPSVGVAVQSYLAPSEKSVNLRFQPPELGALAAGLSTTSFEIAKVPSAPGVAAPPNLYSVLQEKQSVYTNPSIVQLEPVPLIIAEVAKTLANTGGWDFSFLLQSAANIAALEKRLVPLLVQVVPHETLATYAAAVDALVVLTTALGAKANPVVGDLLAVTSALAATTGALRTSLA
jgi:hypothetical protein